MCPVRRNETLLKLLLVIYLSPVIKKNRLMQTDVKLGGFESILFKRKTPGANYLKLTVVSDPEN